MDGDSFILNILPFTLPICFMFSIKTFYFLFFIISIVRSSINWIFFTKNNKKKANFLHLFHTQYIYKIAFNIPHSYPVTSYSKVERKQKCIFAIETLTPKGNSVDTFCICLLRFFFCCCYSFAFTRFFCSFCLELLIRFDLLVCRSLFDFAQKTTTKNGEKKMTKK